MANENDAEGTISVPVEKGDENWLPCINWSGEGDDLPAGLSGMPGIFAWKLVKAVIILDAESDEGFKRLKLSEYDRNTMDIIDVVINQNSYNIILKNHRKGFTFRAASGKTYSREGWRAAFGTDGLHLMAIRELMQGMNKGYNPVFKIGR